MHTERSALNRYRLEADLGYPELAARIGRSVGWLHQFLTSPKPAATERSMYRVRKFLASVQDDVPPMTVRKSRKQRAAA